MIPKEMMKGDEQRRRVYSPNGLCPTLLTPTGGYFETKIIEGDDMDEYWLSDAMQRYIVLSNDKYISGKCLLNPIIARAITTREGETRGDASSYISPDCGDDCEIIAGEDGYPKKKEGANMGRLRIRKLTEGECMRLMGFEEKDTKACRDVGLSKANIYHQSGDSIITTCLVGIFGELLGADYEKAIGEYADSLHKEVCQ